MSSTVKFGRLHWSDLLVIGLYYIGSIAIGIWTICKTKNSIHSFFLAGRSLSWWPIGMSLFASNIGSINFVGIAGSGAASGLAVVMFEWNAIFLLILLGWLFVPVYISSGIYTIPEYLHLRFGGQRIRVYLGVIALLSYVFGMVSVDLYSGALFIQQTVGWNIYIGVAILLGTTVLFTTFGGLRTVVFTDVFAVVVMIAGGITLFVLGMVKVGGIKELYDLYNIAIPNVTLPNTTCGIPRSDAWHIFRNSWSADFPGVATFLRTTFGALWYWCANQVIVQRSLGAKNITHAKAGSILASYLKLTPLIIMVLPGMISRALYPNEVACATPDTCQAVCGNPAGCSNIAYPKLVVELLPNGLRGLLIAAMIAAVISSLTSIFNSSCSIITIDIWKRIRPHANDRELLLVGKIFLFVLVVVSVAWIPLMEHADGGQIYMYATATVGLFGGPTCAIYLLAVLWWRINEVGAFTGLIIGQIWGLIRFVLDIIYPSPLCGQLDIRPSFLKDWNVYYHACSQIVLSAIVAVGISLVTKPIPKNRLAGLTFWTRFQMPDIGDSSDMALIPSNEFEDEEEYTFNSVASYKKYDSDTGDPIELASTKTYQAPTKSIHRRLDENSDDDNDISYRSRTSRKSFCNKCCQVDTDTHNEQYTEPESDFTSVRINSLKESKFWSVFLNVNAVLVVVILITLYIVLR